MEHEAGPSWLPAVVREDENKPTLPKSLLLPWLRVPTAIGAGSAELLVQEVGVGRDI